MPTFGIIGGSGLDNPDILDNPHDIEVQTPYGPLTSPLRAGTINNKKVLLCARHGREHTDPPSQVHSRRNIWALKNQGCDLLIATTAVGSLREEIERGHLVILDQFIDFTRNRPLTFISQFAPHQPQHTPMAEPFDASLRNALIQACSELDIPHHKTGTVITIEGPRFSTRAESLMFRAWGADVINMSLAPECILANEIGLPYAAVAMSTDYDCWKQDEAPVTWEEVLKTFEQNAQKVTDLLIKVISSM